MKKPVKAWLNKQGLCVREELTTRQGIVDLVGYSLFKSRVIKRLQSHRKNSLGNYRRVAIWRAVPATKEGIEISERDLISSFEPHLTQNSIKDEIAYLVEKGFLSRSQNNGLRKNDSWFPLHKSIIAIELKLSRIQDAFQQAYRYQTFADKVYAAFPANVAKSIINTKKVHEFSQAGIGILSVSQQRVQCLFAPKPSNRSLETDEIIQTQLVERFYSATINSST